MIRKRRASIVGGNKKGFTVTDPAGLQRVIPFGDGTKLVTDDGGSTASSAFVPATRTITAGAGLTGGGDLSANRTIDVGAGTGITVNANDVAVNQSVLKLDDFAAPDDNTDLNVSTSAHGLTPKLPNDATKYFDGTGAYTVPAGSGALVQVVNTQTGAVATGTTTIPFDDTIPQNTEGDEYMTLAITPTSTTNKLRIDVNAFVTSSLANWITIALFQDSTANALAATTFHNPTNTAGGFRTLTHYMTAGTTSSTTFKVRIGVDGAATTVTFNGQSGGRLFGGVMASSITITEIAA